MVDIYKPGGQQDMTAVAIIFAVAGVGILGYSLFQGSKTPGTPGGPPQNTGLSDQYGPLAPLKAGESFGDIVWVTSVTPGNPQHVSYDITYAGEIFIVNPVASYIGPGRDCFTTIRVVQPESGGWVTVQQSGIAGINLPASNAPTQRSLVPANQPQPSNIPSQALDALMWPGPAPQPISGRPPALGLADLLVEIYEKKHINDGDGYTSVTYNGRIPVKRTAYPGIINYVEPIYDGSPAPARLG